jgi:hypothetical protein
MDDDAIRNFKKLETNQTGSGVFILNEGNFNYSNASLSYYNLETKEVLNDVFFNVNGLPLGDVAQSITIKDSLAYIVVNNSGKIYIINAATFKYVGKITGLTSPRHIHFIEEHKAYVSDLYAKAITIVDPLSQVIIGKINLDNKNPNFNQHSTEQMLSYGNVVFTNCWSTDNQILVIDSKNDLLIDSIEVALQPNSMVLDKNNKLWVLSDGGFEGSSYGYVNARLTKINADTRVIEHEFIFSDKKASPSGLVLDGDHLYFIYGGSGGSGIVNSGIYKMNITDAILPSNPIIASSGRTFYGLDVHSDGHELFVNDAGNFTKLGQTYRYDGFFELLDVFEVGFLPSDIQFK